MHVELKSVREYTDQTKEPTSPHSELSYFNYVIAIKLYKSKEGYVCSGIHTIYSYVDVPAEQCIEQIVWNPSLT